MNALKRKIALVLSCLILWSGAETGSYSAIKYLNLGNLALEAAIAKERDVQRVLAKDFEDIYYIQLNATEVSSLKGLEKLPNVSSICINETIDRTGQSGYDQVNVKWHFKDLAKYKQICCISYWTADEARLKEFMDTMKQLKHVQSLSISYLGPYLKNVEVFKGVRAKELEISACIEDYSGLSKLPKSTKVTWKTGNSAEGLEENKRCVNIAKQNEVLAKQDEEASRVADEIIKQNNLGALSTDAKIKFVHDYIVNTVTYDLENFKNDTIPNESYNPYGALVLRTAVCDGYSKTFKLFMDKLGVECYRVLGEANGYSSWGGHAWNIVKTEAGYRVVDVTWNDPIIEDGGVSSNLRYDYYLLTDAQLAAKNDHRVDAGQTLPKCE